jgi:acyl carrier protein
MRIVDEDTLRGRVRTLIGIVCAGEGVREVSPAESLVADLNLDSLAIVELFTKIEEEFDLDALGHVEMFDIVTVADVEELVLNIAIA